MNELNDQEGFQSWKTIYDLCLPQLSFDKPFIWGGGSIKGINNEDKKMIRGKIEEIEKLYLDSISNNTPPSVFTQGLLDLLGLSRITILSGTDELSAYGEGHRKDCEKIKAVLIKNGYVNAGLSDALSLWCNYSDTYASGWLWLPDTEEDIFECVEPFIQKHTS